MSDNRADLVDFKVTIKILTLAAPRGIGVTLNPKGGPKKPYIRNHVYDSFQGLFYFFYLVNYNMKKMLRKLGLYLL